ncbi:MAG TPA: beta-glucosidase BglX [Candidatus Sulfotelmatobacter sp.]|jgi:beta-glucosidase|nr:beta-glucosidase BglX [Candidatus Sulfotelmatobacter sp.]
MSAAASNFLKWTLLIWVSVVLPLAAAESPEHRAAVLLAKMTLDEKIGQLTLFTGYGATTGPKQDQQKLEDYVRAGQCGNVFNVLTVDQIRRLQKIAVTDTRLHIPLLFGFDVIHGYKTIFPICLGEAASWDPALIENDSHVAAAEAAAAGLDWTFAPMVDIARDPRWGRMSEGAGEDPFLGSEIARARVHGIQGTNLAAPDALLACVKHFAAYGAAMAGRDYNTVDMSERMLREVYLPPYRAAIDAGALSVMSSFNELNGTPATANSFLLTKILRDEWGFTGFVVTDYGSINEMVNHGSALDEAVAAGQALRAGVDMDMQGGAYLNFLKQLLADHEITKREIDTAVKRILTVKFKLGLFDDPYRHCDEQREKSVLYSKENLAAARRAACESFVLLKNSAETLPLKTGANIAVIGPLADSQRDLLGSWSGAGDSDFLETPLAAIKQENTNGTVVFAQGCDIDTTNRDGFAAAVAAAQNADVAILVLGEAGNMSGESKSRTSINLPGVQTELLQAIKKTGKPVVVVLMNGRPLALEEESQTADALLEAWFPGTEGGPAIADVLFGAENPSGKLPVTFPRNLGQVPIFYAQKNTGRPLDPADPHAEYKSSYIDSPNTPLYPFGYGLSYTTFKFSDVRLDRTAIKPGEKITATVSVTNTGSRPGAEVVQLYLRQLVGSVTRPVLELKGFQKITLAAGESRDISFTIGEKDLTFLRADMTWGTEPGAFQAFIGPNSFDLHPAKFKLLPQ